MTRALDECHVAGIKTNIGFFRQLMDDDPFQRAELHTGLVDEFLARRPVADKDIELQAVAALVAHAFLPVPQQKTGASTASHWRTAGLDDLLQ
jgi:acetyl-CoA carboxylase biotin carboxylase subunit